MNFRELRERRGFPTQYSLARAAQVRQETISQIETRKVRDLRWSTLSKLAFVLGVTPEAVAQAIEKTEAA